ncbi:hypothetical protein C1645_804074 [Glomus cerebriforme]|uniref:HCP-like protein n=1 Tax=Glomus cerebriforme TaxID=658196 RepID=A0A397TAZ0_9GLOM|nr:hypothetical protein C1645_804074 [Glomus cerebriforme]
MKNHKQRKYLISLFYYKDIILDNNYKRNNLETLQKLAENDDLEAQYKLAICYQNGHGINYKKAFKLLLSSAKKGNPDAQFHLAICYITYMDGLGTQKDEEKAFDWVLKSEQN